MWWGAQGESAGVTTVELSQGTDSSNAAASAAATEQSYVGLGSALGVCIGAGAARGGGLLLLSSKMVSHDREGGCL